MTRIEQEVESLVGQFCYAFGAGAQRLRVHRDTIQALQSRYRPYLAVNLQTESGQRAWQDAKYHLLDYLTAMGAYAADLALEGGDMTILPEHFETAAKRFEAAAHRTRSRMIKAGPWCPGTASSDRTPTPEPKAELLSACGPIFDAR